MGLRHALVTGATGTVGRAVVRALPGAGYSVDVWDRSRVPIDDYHRMEAFVRDVDPDVLFHLATASQPTGRDNESWFVNYEWTSELAWICRQLGVRFVFTSTALVFSNDAKGPFTLDSVPDATTGYGYEKLRAERRVLHQNPKALIARLGWQIDSLPVGNTMVHFMAEEIRHHGVVRASTRWKPACAFLGDTADALVKLASSPGLEPGVYMLDANADDAYSFFQIATALAEGRGWRVEATEDYVFDQRLIDPRVKMPPISQRLG